ncbi:MAG: class I SAM-dependent methyltransferase [Microthrixaceae bacterium]|nr:class I SAM-dependent methyltransferase [Microthrixaceae bacterium]
MAVVGDSAGVAAWWSTPASMVFIDGGHGEEPAAVDYRCWSSVVAPGGLLAIHDVFPDPADGGRPPTNGSTCPRWTPGCSQRHEPSGP